MTANLRLPPPPKHLGRASKPFWKSIVTDYELESDHLELLRLACESLDRAERGKLQAQVAEQPPPADSNVIAFDQMGERLRPVANIIRDRTPEHQGRVARHVIEAVVIEDGEVVDVRLRPEARPFYEVFGSGAPGRARGANCQTRGEAGGLPVAASTHRDALTQRGSSRPRAASARRRARRTS